MAKVKHIKNINWDGLKLHNEVNIVADIIVLDIKNGVRQGQDINGSSFKPLKESTSKQKRRKGQPNAPLIATGQMHEVYIKPRATRGKEIANVQVPRGRDGVNRIVVGHIHNTGDGVPKREWFGISKRSLKKIDTALKFRLKEKLRQKGGAGTR